MWAGAGNGRRRHGTDASLVPYAVNARSIPVYVDGMLINMGKGVKPRQAAIDVVGKTAMPLLGGTAIAILAFAAIGTSQDKTGECDLLPDTHVHDDE